jgi:hypothetical protein
MIDMSKESVENLVDWIKVNVIRKSRRCGQDG